MNTFICILYYYWIYVFILIYIHIYPRLHSVETKQWKRNTQINNNFHKHELDHVRIWVHNMFNDFQYSGIHMLRCPSMSWNEEDPGSRIPHVQERTIVMLHLNIGLTMFLWNRMDQKYSHSESIQLLCQHRTSGLVCWYCSGDAMITTSPLHPLRQCTLMVSKIQTTKLIKFKPMFPPQKKSQVGKGLNLNIPKKTSTTSYPQSSSGSSI